MSPTPRRPGKARSTGGADRWLDGHKYASWADLQWRALIVLGMYKEQGQPDPTTWELREVLDVQHATAYEALAGLRRQGLVRSERLRPNPRPHGHAMSWDRQPCRWTLTEKGYQKAVEFLNDVLRECGVDPATVDDEPAPAPKAWRTFPPPKEEKP